MYLELAGAVVVAMAAYVIGRVSGRKAEARERDGLGRPSITSSGNPRKAQATSAPPRRHSNRPHRHSSVYDLSDAEISRVRNIAMNGSKIQAIKELRAMTGAGLKESKDYVEDLMR